MAKKGIVELMKKKHIKLRNIIYAVLLSLPLLLALAIILIVSFTNKSVEVVEKGVMLSPAKDSASLILILSIYILVHLFFVGFLFRNTIKKEFLKKFQQNK